MVDQCWVGKTQARKYEKHQFATFTPDVLFSGEDYTFSDMEFFNDDCSFLSDAHSIHFLSLF